MEDEKTRPKKFGLTEILIALIEVTLVVPRLVIDVKPTHAGLTTSPTPIDLPISPGLAIQPIITALPTLPFTLIQYPFVLQVSKFHDKKYLGLLQINRMLPALEFLKTYLFYAGL